MRLQQRAEDVAAHSQKHADQDRENDRRCQCHGKEEAQSAVTLHREARHHFVEEGHAVVLDRLHGRHEARGQIGRGDRVVGGILAFLDDLVDEVHADAKEQRVDGGLVLGEVGHGVERGLAVQHLPDFVDATLALARVDDVGQWDTLVRGKRRDHLGGRPAAIFAQIREHLADERRRRQSAVVADQLV